MIKEIYVVMGETGEYGDFREWPVIAYFSRDKAIEHAAKAEAVATEIFPHRYDYKWDDPRRQNPYDENMMIDYTGTRYTVSALKLADG